MKKIAIVQSNYLPWKGYFDLIAYVDEFILFDDMQYTRRDWRNRNLIKTPNGINWLTVPVKSKGHYHQSIFDTQIDGVDWAATHFRSLEICYRRAPYFHEIAKLLEPIYQEQSWGSISQLNRRIIQVICMYLGIGTLISNSSEYKLEGGKSERLVSLCRQAGATEYLSGPSAKDYVDENIFKEADIKLTWFDYDNYPQYPQLWGDFVHHVSIIDLLFNCGISSPNYMRYVK